MSQRQNRNVNTALRASALLVCVYAALSGRPPAHAQDGFRPTPYDRMQDQRGDSEKSRQDERAALEKERMADEDRKLQNQYQRLNAVEQTIAGMQGENRIIFAVLGLLQSGSLVVTIRGKKAAAA